MISLESKFRYSNDVKSCPLISPHISNFNNQNSMNINIKQDNAINVKGNFKLIKNENFREVNLKNKISNTNNNIHINHLEQDEGLENEADAQDINYYDYENSNNINNYSFLRFLKFDLKRKIKASDISWESEEFDINNPHFSSEDEKNSQDSSIIEEADKNFNNNEINSCEDISDDFNYENEKLSSMNLNNFNHFNKDDEKNLISTFENFNLNDVNYFRKEITDSNKKFLSRDSARNLIQIAEEDLENIKPIAAYFDKNPKSNKNNAYSNAVAKTNKSLKTFNINTQRYFNKNNKKVKMQGLNNVNDASFKNDKSENKKKPKLNANNNKSKTAEQERIDFNEILAEINRMKLSSDNSQNNFNHFMNNNISKNENININEELNFSNNIFPYKTMVYNSEILSSENLSLMQNVSEINHENNFSNNKNLKDTRKAEDLDISEKNINLNDYSFSRINSVNHSYNISSFIKRASNQTIETINRNSKNGFYSKIYLLPNFLIGFSLILKHFI